MDRLAVESVRTVFRPRHGAAVIAVDDVSLRAQPSEIVCIVGPSGCGKSTLLRSIAGLETPEQGRITIDGRDVTNVAPNERGVGFVFQSGGLYSHLSVAENIGFAMTGGRDEIHRAVQDVAARLAIEPLLARRPDTLSGGERQRATIAKALARRAGVVLLDEPLASLDAPLRHQLRRELRAVLRASGVSAVWVTHDQDEAAEVADRIVVLSKGRCRQAGPYRELVEYPVDAMVAGFIGTPPRNVLQGRIVDAGAGSLAFVHTPNAHAVAEKSMKWHIGTRAARDWRIKAGDAVQLFVPPRALAPAPADSAEAAVSVLDVLDVLDQGDVIRALVRTETSGVLCAMWPAGDSGERSGEVVRAGEAARMRVDMSRCMFFEPGEAGATLRENRS